MRSVLIWRDEGEDSHNAEDDQDKNQHTVDRVIGEEVDGSVNESLQKEEDGLHTVSLIENKRALWVDYKL